MQEPVSASVPAEDVENIEQQIVDPLSAPVDMEAENSIKQLLPHDDNIVIESPVPTYIEIIDSSPNPTKNSNDSLDLLIMQSADSPPAVVDNKENLEPKHQNNEQDDIVKTLKKIIYNLKAKSARDLSLAKKVTRRDIVDKMSANHKLSLSKERKNHFKLLRETREIYEKRLRDVEKFYAERVAFLEENRTLAFDGLLETKNTLEDHVKKTNESISSIINIISLYPSNLTTAIPITKSIEKRLSASRSTENVDNESKYSDKVAKLEKLETEVYEQKLRITCLENKIKDEITSKSQIQQKLAYTEILYRTTLREKDEHIKNLQDELSNLKNSKNEMENRHKEQFVKYDRMLKRAQSEISVQKREVLALRTQFVPGTPNFNAVKQMETPSMIKESTPSSSKMSSNLTGFLGSSSKKATLRSESTPSFDTAASVPSSPSGNRSLVQTPSSKASKSKSLRSRKVPSENSTTSSAVALHSDDSCEPVQKSARILRNRRKRVAKPKKGL